jgi:hypothetical protein
MNYTEKQFFALIEEIEAQGGELTDELCKSRTYTFTGEETSKPLRLAGCGNTSIFMIYYDAGKDDKLDAVKLCAVCDDLGSAPRFAHAI